MKTRKVISTLLAITTLMTSAITLSGCKAKSEKISYPAYFENHEFYEMEKYSFTDTKLFKDEGYYYYSDDAGDIKRILLDREFNVKARDIDAVFIAGGEEQKGSRTNIEIEYSTLLFNNSKSIPNLYQSILESIDANTQYFQTHEPNYIDIQDDHAIFVFNAYKLIVYEVYFSNDTKEFTVIQVLVDETYIDESMEIFKELNKVDIQEIVESLSKRG